MSNSTTIVLCTAVPLLMSGFFNYFGSKPWILYFPLLGLMIIIGYLGHLGIQFLSSGNQKTEDAAAPRATPSAAPTATVAASPSRHSTSVGATPEATFPSPPTPDGGAKEATGILPKVSYERVFHDIEIEPPGARAKAATRFIGSSLECQADYRRFYPDDTEFTTVYFWVRTTDKSIREITCVVKLEQHPELQYLHENSVFLVRGTIAKVTGATIDLKDASIQLVHDVEQLTPTPSPSIPATPATSATPVPENSKHRRPHRPGNRVLNAQDKQQIRSALGEVSKYGNAFVVENNPNDREASDFANQLLNCLQNNGILADRPADYPGNSSEPNIVGVQFQRHPESAVPFPLWVKPFRDVLESLGFETHDGVNELCLVSGAVFIEVGRLLAPPLPRVEESSEDGSNTQNVGKYALKELRDEFPAVHVDIAWWIYDAWTPVNFHAALVQREGIIGIDIRYVGSPDLNSPVFDELRDKVRVLQEYVSKRSREFSYGYMLLALVVDFGGESIETFSNGVEKVLRVRHLPVKLRVYELAALRKKYDRVEETKDEKSAAS